MDGRLRTSRCPSIRRVVLGPIAEVANLPCNCPVQTIVGKEVMVAPKTGRVEARLSDNERMRIDRAAQLAGQSVSSFVVSAAVEKADQVIAESDVTSVPADYFDRLLASIDRADRAPRLTRAAKRARQARRIG